MGDKLKKTNVGRRANFKWTERWDDLFIDALINQQSMGNRSYNVFTTTAYENIVKELREKIGNPFQKGHLKNRLKTLKNNLKECYDLFKDVNGFTWSPETKMWNAKPDVWKALIKVKPEAKKWMTTPIANYNKLLFLFAKERTKQDANHHVTLGKDAVFDTIDLVISQNDIIHRVVDLNGISNGANKLPNRESISQVDTQAPSQSAT